MSELFSVIGVTGCVLIFIFSLIFAIANGSELEVEHAQAIHSGFAHYDSKGLFVWDWKK